jgi:peptidoglycan/LPS O-acetylase OafA/YrhL
VTRQLGRNRRFAELDVLRGIAALAVVVFHYSGHETRYFAGFPFNFKPGVHGVQLFFGISGFVIFLTLDGTKRLRDFVVSRFSRLYPAYWATIAVLAAVDAFETGKVWLTGIAVNATMLQSFIGFQDFDLVFWTLGVELAFYVIMGTLFALGWTRRIVTVAVVWLAVAAAAAVAYPHLPTWAPVYAARFLILPHAPYFIIGMMWYRIQRDGLNAASVSVIVAAIATAFVAGGIEDGIVALIVASLLGVAVAGGLRFAVSRATLWLGAISYPLYLLHRNLGYQVLFALNARHMPSIDSFFVAVAFALVLATIVNMGVERPAMTAIRNWYKAWSAKASRQTAGAPAQAQT